MKLTRISSPAIALWMLSVTGHANAHDPVFGLGPHVLFKGGIEIAPEVRTARQGDNKTNDLALELTYGLTGDWSAGVDLPYAFRDNDGNRNRGSGDAALFTKYRFWRKDTLGAQESAAILGKLVFDTGEDSANPPTGSGSTDSILGLAWGYESRRWYRWASVRWRHNTENKDGLQRGDRLLTDLVGGIRLHKTGYLQPDTVWLLELNGEHVQKSELNGSSLSNTGGSEWFISPGIFWTKRNFAVKAGVQVPFYSDLKGRQDNSDYRARLILEWHL
ncbi:secreted protein [hydrothermal vent metagenome]|uniref:Secreted protein n=1 Tax=hydrothermal vent metagenome TaxID=652676 RepID=A0A3B0YW83_9ZZZZ